MSQTSIIAGGLLLAYFIFIVRRGELPCYLQVLGVSTATDCPQGNIAPSASICASSSSTAAPSSGSSGGSSGTPVSGSGGGFGSGIGSGFGGVNNSGCYYGMCDDGTCAGADGYCGDL